MTSSDIEKAVNDPIRLATTLRDLREGDLSIVNVYEIAKRLGIYIKYTVFESNQGGFYIPPEDEDDIHLVLINAKDSITRQRFSLAHEIAHMLRFQYNGVRRNTPRNRKKEDDFCDKFAEHLLIPKEKLEKALDAMGNPSFIDLKDIHVFARMFGVSFSMMTRVLAYRENKIEGETESQVLTERINLYLESPKDNFNHYWNHILNLYRMAINAYPFNYFDYDPHRELRRIINYIYNELKNEGVVMPVEKLSELVTDARLNRLSDMEEYPEESIHKITEAVGQYRLYQDLQNTDHCNDITLHDVKTFHRRLYTLAPYKDDIGKFRNTDNIVKNGTVETTEHTSLQEKFYQLSRSFDQKITEIDNLTHSELIEFAVKTHYQLVRLHPFPDGNGRVTRAFMNRLLTCRNIPPIFFYNEEKSRYIENLKSIDRFGNYTGLFVQVYKAILFALAG